MTLDIAIANYKLIQLFSLFSEDNLTTMPLAPVAVFFLQINMLFQCYDMY